MQGYQIYKNLGELNSLPPDEAEAIFLSCCGSTCWAGRMTERRPFNMLEDLFEAARNVWFSLSASDHLEAFAAHPKIGSNNPPARQPDRSAVWSAGEQAKVEDADTGVLQQLAEANRLYHEKFGFIFIVFATGKTAEEMLAICQARYGNSVETELQIAAEEQLKITELRIAKLLET